MTGVLEAMAALGLPVTWEVVRLGWEGPGALGPQLDVAAVRAFADGVIADADPAALPDLAALALASGGAEVGEALRRLAPAVGPRAERVWRAWLVARRLDDLPPTPAAGLVALTELWGDLGFPDGMPHEVQGRGANRAAPAEYYTPESLERLVARHRRWLDAELVALESPST